jgi:hypothetical protein
MPDLSSSLRDLIDGSSAPIDVHAIVGARRRRRLRRRVGVAGAVVLIAAVVTGSVLARPASEPKVSVGGRVTKHSEATATRAALGRLTIVSPGGGSGARSGGSPGAVTLTDAASGASHSVAFPIPDVQSSSSPYLVLGSNLVVTVNQQTGPYDPAIGTAYVMSSTLGQWRTLGPASSFALAAPDGRHVWLATDNATPDQRLHGTEYGTSRSVFEVGLDGTRSSSYPLTDLRSVIAAVDGGLLTSRPGPTRLAPHIVEVWDPETNRVVRRVSVGGDDLVASPKFVTWTARTCATLRCPLHVTDISSGRDRVIAPPRAMQWSAQTAFSPDGTRLALIALPPPDPNELGRDSLTVPPGTQPARVVVVDLATEHETQRVTTAWKGSPSPSWSPDGSLVFFVHDLTHVGYVNADYAAGPVREIPVTNAAYYLVAAKPAPVTATQHYAYDGHVSQSKDHSPELCVYASDLVLRPGADNCAGPAVVGWDWNKLQGLTRSGGVTSGDFHVVGTYDGDVFTLTQPPGPKQKQDGTPAPKFDSGCATPPGGWQETNPALVTFDDYTAVTNAARAAPDFAGLWFGPSAVTNGVTDLPHSVINVAYTGNLAAHRAELAALWGGPICVVRHPHAYAELERISHELIGSVGKQLGLRMLSSGPDDVRDVVHADAVAVPPATQAAIDARYGKGLVEITGVLRPVPSR